MTTLTLSSHFKVVIYNVHHEARYQAALAFIDAAEPTAQGGLARAYRNTAGETLNTLEEVVRAANDGTLASLPPA